MQQNIFPSESLCTLMLKDSVDFLKNNSVQADLVILDPPYGGIVKDEYDRIRCQDLSQTLVIFMESLQYSVEKGATAYVFGGVGKYRNRPFFQFILDVEKETAWRMHNFITWKKRRGYGTQFNYLFCREEIAMFVLDAKKPKTFNIPYLDEERSDAWKKRLSRKDVKYTPRCDKMRRSNVFADINELFRNKFCAAEKPEKLYEILVETSSNPGDLVLDPMCGSGTTGVVCDRLGRRSILMEKDPEMFKISHKRILS